PDPKGCAVRNERRAGWRLRKNVLPGKHGLLSLQHCYRRDRCQMLRCTSVACLRPEHRTTRECTPAQRRFWLRPKILVCEADRPGVQFWDHRMPAVEKITISPGLAFDALVSGEPGARLVLLLHGFAESMHCWRAQVTALAAAGYRAVGA